MRALAPTLTPRWPALALCLALAGCFSPRAAIHWVAPFDGQTSVDPAAPLVIQASYLDYPESLSLPQDVITVVDLTDGAPVAGVVVRPDALGLFFDEDQPGSQLHFVPDAPWRADARYAWRVEPALANPRGPTVAIDEDLAGEAVFSTTARAALIGAVTEPGIPPDGGFCFVFSQPVLPELLADASLTVLPAGADASQLGQPAFAEAWEPASVSNRASRFWAEAGMLCAALVAEDGAPFTLAEGAELTLTRDGALERATLSAAFATELLDARHRYADRTGGR